MKKIFLILLSAVMMFVNCGAVRAEEAEPFKNLKSNEYIKIMANTVMVRPGSPDAFVYGKRYNLEKYGDNAETKKTEKGVIVKSEFIKDAFPEAVVEGEECELFEFAAKNGLNIKDVNGNIYISKNTYDIPDSISGYIVKFFGIYVKSGAKGTGTFESPCGSIEIAKSTVSEIKKSVGLPDGGITVYLREGTFGVPSTIYFGESDSGLDGAPIIYRAYKDEEVYFDGGVSVKGSDFAPVTDSQVKSKLPIPEKVVGVDLSAKLSGFGDGYKSQDPASWNVIYNDSLLTVARWPNGDYAYTEEVIKGMNPVRYEGFEFVVGDSRMKKWAKEDDPRIFGYFAFTWAGERRSIVKFNTELLSITSDDFAQYGISADKPYYVYNMLCELDEPGEFYFDKKNNYLYIYPVEGDPKNSEFLNNKVQFSLLSADMFSFAGTENVVFKGLTLENSLGQGVNISNTCKNIQIRGCVFRNLQNAINMAGYNHLISGCDMYNITGRVLNSSCGDRATLTPSGTVIQNNRFWNFNTTQRTNSSCVVLNGVADLVTHNEIVGGPHICVSPSGNDNVIEYNELYDNLQDQAADAGPVYNGRNCSSLGTIIRNNYFHDIPASMGTIYFDDGQSDQTVDGNVFENTGKIVFIHGGVGNKVIDNLSLNDVAQGIGFSAVDGSQWDYSYADSEAHNTFLYWLTFFDWKKEPWTKYNHIFKYINNTDADSMYDTVISGNTFVNLKDEMLGITEKDYANITDENNTVINGEEAENYVIPERYREVMDKAGIYYDEDRKEMPELGTFNLLSPMNKTENVEASSVTFKWSAAENAYSYQFILATDKNFENIISNKIVKTTSLTLEKLNYFNTRYYWKVKAIANDTNSITGDLERMSKQEYYTFTTKAVEVISTEKLTEMIETCRGKMTAVVEGENPGENKPGTIDSMNALLTEYQQKAESSSITQKEVTTFTKELEEKFNKLIYKKNPQVFDMAAMVSNGGQWAFTPNQVVFGKNKMTITNIGSNTLGTNARVEPQMIYKFKVNSNILESGSWYAFAMRAQSSPTLVAWGGNPQYMILVKKDTIELQKWGGSGNVVNSYPNNCLKDGVESEIEMFALDQDDGTILVSLKVNGELIAEYVDEETTNEGPGFFEIYANGLGNTLDIIPITE